MFDPAVMLVALTASTGAAVTGRLTEFDAPPPGAAVLTPTAAVDALAMSNALMVALSCVAPTNVVGRGEPFHVTTERLRNFVPVTVNVNAGPPATMLAGESEVTVGTPAKLGSTVIVGLVTTRLLFTNRRNSYVPAVEGIAIVHVRDVTPSPTYVHVR